MSASDRSLSLSAQDPSGNTSWECSSCLGEAPQEFVGFTSCHLSPPVPCRVLPRAMCSGKLQTGLLVGGYFLYLLVGAAVFQALERTAEKQQKMAAAQMKEAFLQNFTHLTVAEMEQFMKNLTVAIQNGVYPVGNESQTENSNWDFSNSFFFAGTVVSTIGYGTLRPKTAGGQIFCVFFALFGIPLNIVFLHRVGKILSLLCKKLGKFLYEKGMRKKIKFLTLLFFLVTGILVFLCLPSLFFQITEGWSYSEGIYFAFITLSTIGFGDYVVGKQPGRIYFSYYRTLVAIWILFGLAWIALLFNLLTTVLEDTEKIIVKDLHQIGKVGEDNAASQPRRCWPVQFIPEEELIPPRGEGDAQKMESSAAEDAQKNGVSSSSF
ncbi:potassium channel subfamily K member 16-like isoform X2 [Numida meleagris]|uniref:potassium channel subfamily K member 16-like isoform X2 n=1 Tax=Numida meleagris TaxID=8996 RepID=UPI000B3DF793|nr:potassium channel subfamily K member 16-like isoform X2 [Numida meleagris]